MLLQLLCNTQGTPLTYKLRKFCCCLANTQKLLPQQGITVTPRNYLRSPKLLLVPFECPLYSPDFQDVTLAPQMIPEGHGSNKAQLGPLQGM